jgi:hypothetical protein|uniref:Uncharacterized protein n=1 Tax=Zea mays TaxID=4577 RepID=C4J5Z2_MAIZE|nr:unknown [Zea mays]
MDVDDADQDAAGVDGQSRDAASQKSWMREASLPAEARLENVAASGAESGDSLAKRKAGCGRLLLTFRFQYRINAAFAVNGFTGSDVHTGMSRGRPRGSAGTGGGDGEAALDDAEGDGSGNARVLR